MPVSFKCPKCSKIFQVSDDKAGLAASCRCGMRFRIPSLSAEEPDIGADLIVEGVIEPNYSIGVDDTDVGAEQSVVEQKKPEDTYIEPEQPAVYHSVFGRILLMIGACGLLVSTLRPVIIGTNARNTLDGLSILIASFDSYPAIFLYPISLLFSLMFLGFAFIGLKVGKKGGLLFSILTFILSLSGIWAVAQAATETKSYFSIFSSAAVGSVFSAEGMLAYIVGAVLFLAGGIICSFGIFVSYRDMYSQPSDKSGSQRPRQSRGKSFDAKERTPDAAVMGTLPDKITKTDPAAKDLETEDIAEVSIVASLEVPPEQKVEKKTRKSSRISAKKMKFKHPVKPSKKLSKKVSKKKIKRRER